MKNKGNSGIKGRKKTKSSKLEIGTDQRGHSNYMGFI